MSTQGMKLQAIADAIREKDGTTEPISANDFPDRIRAISSVPEGLHTIALTADPPEGGAVTGGGAASKGMIVTVSAEAADGYNFNTWQEGGQSVSEDVEYTFNVSKNRTLVAVFEEHISRLPEGYTEVQYIKFDTNSSVDTGLISNPKTRWVMDVEVDASSYASSEYLLYASVLSSYFRLYLYKAHTQIDFYYCSKYNSRIENPGIDGVRTVIDADIPNLLLTVGELHATLYTTSIVSSAQGNTYIGKLATDANANTAKFKLFSSQMYSDGELAADFIPCIAPTGTAGLYDVVREAFYANAGTGAFTAGPAV